LYQSPNGMLPGRSTGYQKVDKNTCQHAPLVELTVFDNGKNGPNAGKRFIGCPICRKSFKWLDAPASKNAGQPANPQFTFQSSEPLYEPIEPPTNTAIQSMQEEINEMHGKVDQIYRWMRPTKSITECSDKNKTTTK